MNKGSIVNLYCVCWYNMLAVVCFYKGSLYHQHTYNILLINGSLCIIASYCSMVCFIHNSLIVTRIDMFNVIKYIEWTICTPLMVYNYGVINNLSYSKNIICVILTIAFCLSGAIAGLTKSLIVKSLLGVQGIIYSVYVLYQLWMAATLGDSALKKMSILNLVVTSMIWPMYVIFWGVGPDVLMIMTSYQENLAENLLGIVLKTSSAIYVVSSADIVYKKKTSVKIQARPSQVSTETTDTDVDITAMVDTDADMESDRDISYPSISSSKLIPITVM